jgi:hypothetical protein
MKFEPAAGGLYTLPMLLFRQQIWDLKHMCLLPPLCSWFRIHQGSVTVPVCSSPICDLPPHQQENGNGPLNSA